MSFSSTCNTHTLRVSISFHNTQIADESDYTRIDTGAVGTVVVFTNATRRLCFDLMITDDELVEGEEQLTVRLTEDPFAPPTVTVQFAPNITQVTITDRDGM